MNAAPVQPHWRGINLSQFQKTEGLGDCCVAAYYVPTQKDQMSSKTDKLTSSLPFLFNLDYKSWLLPSVSLVSGAILYCAFLYNLLLVYY